MTEYIRTRALLVMADSELPEILLKAGNKELADVEAKIRKEAIRALGGGDD